MLLLLFPFLVFLSRSFPPFCFTLRYFSSYSSLHFTSLRSFPFLFSPQLSPPSIFLLWVSSLSPQLADFETNHRSNTICFLISFFLSFSLSSSSLCVCVSEWACVYVCVCMSLSFSVSLSLHASSCCCSSFYLSSFSFTFPFRSKLTISYILARRGKAQEWRNLLTFHTVSWSC